MFKIKQNCESIIVDFCEESVISSEISELRAVCYQDICQKRFAMDLKNVSSLDNDFFVFLKEFSSMQKISLFNISSEIAVLLSLMNCTQFTYLYANENDFLEKKRAIVHRNFRFC